jgi:hypothetical protein
MRYRSYPASKKLKIIEEDETEIGLLEENSMSAELAYVIDDEMSLSWVRGLLQ